MSQGFRPKHPCSSTTNDVECFFSVLRDMVGKDFTLKQVCFFLLLVDLIDSCVHMYEYYGWRIKVSIEFLKEWTQLFHFITLQVQIIDL